jgi:hypothetical protein
MRDSANKCISAETLIAGTDQEGALWGASAARRIVVAISDDADNGVLSPGEAIELIERVWARTSRWR